MVQTTPSQNSDLGAIQFYKCLSDSIRLRCLMLIQLEEELCVCEFVTALQEIQPKISRNLAQLKRCGILQDRRQGQWVFYRLSPFLPAWARQILAITTEQHAELIRPHLNFLQQMGNRPERVQLCCN